MVTCTNKDNSHFSYPWRADRAIYSFTLKAPQFTFTHNTIPAPPPLPSKPPSIPAPPPLPSKPPSYLWATVDMMVLATVEAFNGHLPQSPLLLGHKGVHPEGLSVDLVKPDGGVGLRSWDNLSAGLLTARLLVGCKNQDKLWHRACKC